MATTKIWKVQKRLDHVIDYATNEEKTKNKFYKETQDDLYSIRQALLYATNPDKTEKKFYTTGINCEVENAIEQMIATKKKNKKERGILAFHAYQSFAKGEVTPEVAHEIGVKLAEEMWGDRFEVVVSTHLNTQCIHNHFVLNSVSFKDGYKYYSNLENTALFRKTSDDICDEFGLKVLGEKACKSGINFENFYRKSLRNSDYYNFAKEDLDYAIKNSYSKKEFEQMLIAMGYNYSYRAGKLSIRREPYKRNIRVERAFGEEYSMEKIGNRIYRNPIRKNKNTPWVKSLNGKYFSRKGSVRNWTKPKGIRALYYHYCYLLKVYPKRNEQYKLSPYMRVAVRKMEDYSQKNRFLAKYKITTLDEIQNVKKEQENNLRKHLNLRDKLYYKKKNLNTDEEKDAVYKDIIAVTEQIKTIRKEIRFCNEIEKSVPITKNEIKELEEREKMQKEMVKNKKKERRYER